MNKKITFLVGSLIKGGAENQMIKLAVNLKRKDYDVNVCYFIADNDFELILRKNKIKSEIISLKMGLGLIYLINKINKEKTDVLISFMFLSNIFARLVRIFCNVKLITSVRASQISVLYQFFYKLTYKLDDVSTFNSKVALERLKKMKITVPAKSIIVNNAISIPDRENKLNIVNDVFKIVSIAHFREKEKDYKTLFKALKIVKLKGYDFKLYAIGNHFGSSWPSDKVKELALVDNIDFLGFIHNPDIYLKKSDILVLSTFGESTPNAILEGMAHSLPIISTDVPGCAVLLDESKAGFLSKIEDANDLADKIIVLMNMSNKLRQELGTNGYNYVCENYNEKVVFSKWEKIIN